MIRRLERRLRDLRALAALLGSYVRPGTSMVAHNHLYPGVPMSSCDVQDVYASKHLVYVEFPASKIRMVSCCCWSGGGGGGGTCL